MIRVMLPNSKAVEIEKTAVSGRQLIRAASKIKSHVMPRWGRSLGVFTSPRTGKIYIDPEFRGAGRGLFKMHESFERKYLSRLKPAEKTKLLKTMTSPKLLTSPSKDVFLKQRIPGKVAPMSGHFHPGVLLREHNILATAKGGPLKRMRDVFIKMRGGSGETGAMKSFMPARAAFELGKSPRYSRHAIKRLEPIMEKRLAEMVKKDPAHRRSTKDIIEALPKKQRAAYRGYFRVGERATKELI
jgi:hypothetical protein